MAARILNKDPLTETAPWRRLERADAFCAGAVALFHLVVSAVYVKIVGISIVADPQRNTWDWLWQLLPLDDLRHDLWRSLWFLHAQPPLYNLYGGILADLFYPHHLQVLHALNVLAGALMSGLVWLLSPGAKRARTVLVCAAIGLVPLGWCAKNCAQFGFFGTSSWRGMGLWRTVASSYEETDLRHLSEAGVIDRTPVDHPVFTKPSVYEPYGFDKRSAVRVLSRNDCNNVNFPDISALYGRNAVRLMAHGPGRYASAVWRAYRIFCRPSSRYLHLEANGIKMGYHERLYSDVLEGGLIVSAATGDYVTFLVFLIPGTLALYCVQILRRRAEGRVALLEALSHDAVMVWCFVLVLYTAVAGSLFEIGENMRFKFLVEQPMWIFIAVVLVRMCRLARARCQIVKQPCRGLGIE